MNSENRQRWRWIDEISAYDFGLRKLEASHFVNGDEWFFEPHFPGFPVVPGVLLIESMAHAVGLLQALVQYERTARFSNYVLARVSEARLYAFARPESHLQLHARLLSELDDDSVVEGTCDVLVDGRRIARAKLMLHELDLPAQSSQQDPFRLREYLERVLTPPLRALMFRDEALLRRGGDLDVTQVSSPTEQFDG